VVTPQQCCSRAPSSALLEMPAVRHDLLQVATVETARCKKPSQLCYGMPVRLDSLLLRERAGKPWRFPPATCAHPA